MFRRIAGSISKFFACYAGMPALSNELAFYEVEIPDPLRCPISLDLLENPVITPAGHIYSRQTLYHSFESGRAICPLSNQRITWDQVRAAPQEVFLLLTELRSYQANVRTHIIRSSPTELPQNIVAYRARLNEFAARMTVIRQRLITQSTIQAIKNRLKIDLTSPNHLRYWQAKGKKGRQIPTHIHNMMHTAQHSYETVDVFIQALDSARQVGKYSRFFKDCFRDPQTKAVYNTRDLRNFVVR